MARKTKDERAEFASAPLTKWDAVPLSELVERERGISYGIVQPGTHTIGGVPIVRVTDIRNGRINTGSPLLVSEDIAGQYRRTKLRGGEVLLSLVGTVGESAVVPNELKGWNTARAVAVLPILPEVGGQWVHVCLQYKEIQHLIHTWCTTSVQATFNLRDVARLPIPLPPRNTRETILNVLSPLDDKIECNRRINQTLEAIAHTLYKHWFVDFAPFYSSGVVESELGLIPKGWWVSTLGKTSNLLMGQSPPSEFYNDSGEGLPFHQGVTNFGWRFPRHTTYCTNLARVAEAGSILFSVRAPVGRINLTDRRVVIGRGIASINHKKNLQSFLFYQLKHVFEKEDSIGSGTIFNAVTKSELENVKLISPLDDIALKFDSIVAIYDKQIEVNENEIQTLTTTRDYLLPKLLSGEIEVKAAEEAVEAAV